MKLVDEFSIVNMSKIKKQEACPVTSEFYVFHFFLKNGMVLNGEIISKLKKI